VTPLAPFGAENPQQGAGRSIPEFKSSPQINDPSDAGPIKLSIFLSMVLWTLFIS
jgi:hypothetical protein